MKYEDKCSHKMLLTTDWENWTWDNLAYISFINATHDKILFFFFVSLFKLGRITKMLRIDLTYF